MIILTNYIIIDDEMQLEITIGKSHTRLWHSILSRVVLKNMIILTFQHLDITKMQRML